MFYGALSPKRCSLENGVFDCVVPALFGENLYTMAKVLLKKHAFGVLSKKAATISSKIWIIELVNINYHYLNISDKLG